MPPLPYAEPIRQASFAPAWLLTVGALRLATRDLVIPDPLDDDIFDGAILDPDVDRFWSGALLNRPTVTRRTQDAFWGVTERSEVTVEIANAAGAYDTLWSGDVTGSPVSLSRYDEVSGEVTEEFAGVVATVERGVGTLRLRCVSLDLSVFEQELGRAATVELFHASCPDAGRMIPVVIGTVPKVPCPYVRDDVGGNLYDYCVGEGALGVSAVYRDGPSEGTYELVSPSDYTVSTGLYSGVTVLRFTRRQVNFGGGFHRIFADVVGLSAERNPARAIRTILADAAWGLGQTVQSASFAEAEAAVPAALRVDGVLLERTPAQDVLRELMRLRGMRLGASAGGWTLTVDTERTEVALRVGAGLTSGEQNLVNTLSATRTRTRLEDRITTYELRYRLELATGEYQHVQSRAVGAVGQARTLDAPWLRDHTAADLVLCYLAKRELYGQTTAVLELPQEARRVREGDLLEALYEPLDYTGQIVEVVAVEVDALGALIATVRDWDPDLYVYDAGTLPEDPTFDPSVQRPDPTTDLAIISTDTEQASDGTTTALVVLAMTIPALGVAVTRIDVRRTGTTAWQQGWATVAGSGAQSVTVGARVPGLAYDYRAVTVNAKGLECTTPQSLTNQLAPGDTAAPATPATPSVLSKQNKTGTFQWAAGTEDDLKEYEWDVRTASGGGGSLVASGKASIGKVTVNLADAGAAYDTAYYFRVRALDFTGNASAYSAAVSVTFSRSQTDDISAGAISAQGASATGGPTGLTAAYANLATVALTLASGDIVLVVGSYRADSIDVSSSRTVYMRLRESGGGASSEIYTTVPPLESEALSQGHIFTGLTGSITFAVQGRTTGAGAVNAASIEINVLRLKR